MDEWVSGSFLGNNLAFFLIYQEATVSANLMQEMRLKAVCGDLKLLLPIKDIVLM